MVYVRQNEDSNSFPYPYELALRSKRQVKFSISEIKPTGHISDPPLYKNGWHYNWFHSTVSHLYPAIPGLKGWLMATENDFGTQIYEWTRNLSNNICRRPKNLTLIKLHRTNTIGNI